MKGSQMRAVKTFLMNEDGAVTVDWVVLTAAIVGLVVLLTTAMQNNALSLTGAVSDFMSNWTF
jgi:Flp pilus assembly pilin Flp